MTKLTQWANKRNNVTNTKQFFKVENMIPKCCFYNKQTNKRYGQELKMTVHDKDSPRPKNTLDGNHSRHVLRIEFTMNNPKHPIKGTEDFL